MLEIRPLAQRVEQLEQQRNPGSRTNMALGRSSMIALVTRRVATSGGSFPSARMFCSIYRRAISIQCRRVHRSSTPGGRTKCRPSFRCLPALARPSRRPRSNPEPAEPPGRDADRPRRPNPGARTEGQQHEEQHACNQIETEWRDITGDPAGHVFGRQESGVEKSARRRARQFRIDTDLGVRDRTSEFAHAVRGVVSLTVLRTIIVDGIGATVRANGHTLNRGCCATGSQGVASLHQWSRIRSASVPGMRHVALAHEFCHCGVLRRLCSDAAHDDIDFPARGAPNDARGSSSRQMVGPIRWCPALRPR